MLWQTMGEEQLEALNGLSARLKHDLGKYIAFQTRWLAPEGSHEERVTALQADVLATRRGPGGTVSAHEVWAGFRGQLRGEVELQPGLRVQLATDADVEAIDAAMCWLGGHVVALRDGQIGVMEAKEAVDACHQVAAACARLHRRTREALTHG